MRRASVLAVIGLVLAVASGCNQWTTQRPLTFGVPDRAGPEDAFDHVVSTLRREGYRIILLQPAQRRVGVCTRYRDKRSYQFGSHCIAITCEVGNYCRIWALGPRVEETPATAHMPRALAEEVRALRQALVQRSPGVSYERVTERVQLEACD